MINVENATVAYYGSTNGVFGDMHQDMVRAYPYVRGDTVDDSLCKDRRSMLSLMAARRTRSHLRGSAVNVAMTTVYEWYKGAPCLDRVAIRAINLVHLPHGEGSLVITAYDLPSMCGGASLFVADAKHTSKHNAINTLGLH